MSKFCPSCGEELVDNAKFCKNCGINLENMEKSQNTNQSQQYQVPIVEKEHTAAIVIGYILALLIPLFGFMVGIYLITRNDSQKAKNHGKYVMILSAVIWVLSFLMIR